MAKRGGWRRYQANNRFRRGVAAVEFALMLPLWATLLLGISDGTYCMLVNEKVDRIAYSVTDIVTQYQTISIANLNDIVMAASQLMKPFPFGVKGVVVVTSVYKPTGLAATISWQYTGGGSLVRASRIGSQGGVPSLPNGLTLNDNENVIITEVYYTYAPLFLSDTLFPAGDIYRTAVYKPRLSPLITVPI